MTKQLFEANFGEECAIFWTVSDFEECLRRYPEKTLSLLDEDTINKIKEYKQ